MDAPLEKIVVQTEFSAKLQTEYDTVRKGYQTNKMKFTLFGIIGVVCSFFGVALIVPFLITRAAYNVFLVGLFLVVIGVYFLLSARSEQRSIKNGDYLPIKPNKITLTFNDEGVDVDVTGGKPGDVYFSYYVLPNMYLPGNTNDIKFYGKEHWLYRDLNVRIAKDYFWIAKNFVTYGIVFRGSQIIEGDMVQLRKLLKEKLGSKYKDKTRYNTSQWRL